MIRKNTWLAIILSLVMPGLGYVYLGRKLLFGIFLLVSDIAGLLWMASLPQGAFQVDVFFIIALVAFYGAIILDTYYTAATLDRAMPMKADPVSSAPASHDKAA